MMPWSKENPCPPEVREKIRQTLQGKKLNDAHREAIRAGLKGKKKTREHVEKMKSTKNSAEYRENLREKMLNSGKWDAIGTRKVDGAGYVRIKVSHDGHRVGWKMEHRVIMEQIIGRPLRRYETVHHIDGVRSNNDPANLLLLTSAQHNKLNHFLSLLSSVDTATRNALLLTINLRFPHPGH